MIVNKKFLIVSSSSSLSDFGIERTSTVKWPGFGDDPVICANLFLEIYLYSWKRRIQAEIVIMYKAMQCTQSF